MSKPTKPGVPAILPSAAGVPPGESRPVPQLGPLVAGPTRDLELSPSVGRLPAEAQNAPMADYGDASPERPGDPGPTQSPPAKAPTFAQLKGEER